MCPSVRSACVRAASTRRVVCAHGGIRTVARDRRRQRCAPQMDRVARSLARSLAREDIFVRAHGRTTKMFGRSDVLSSSSSRGAVPSTDDDDERTTEDERRRTPR